MAYAALVSLAQLLDQFLHRHQASFAAHKKKKQKIESLHEKIDFMTAFLEDFPTEAAELEARITVATNQTEDIFEYHILHENSPKYETRPSHVLYFSREVPLFPLVRLYKDLQKPIKEIDSILEEVMQIKSSIGENQMLSHSSASFSSGLAPNVNGTVVGFEEDLMKLKGRLFGDPSKLEIIPIVGMGGIGKTTLVRYALDDPSTFYHFDVRACVTVSQISSGGQILLSLLNSIDASTKGEYIHGDTEYLVERVYRYLIWRRFLIVIDDLWNGNVWDDVRRAFPNDLNGSRIVITTRNLDVVSYIDSSSYSLEMHLMDVEKSWNLLRQKVFAEECCPPHLVEIGKLIAKKCGGLPLAIVLIAGVLSKVNRVQETWTTIARDVFKVGETSDEPFSEILFSSYTHLPHHLRPCFLYMGGFPEDHEISASKLTRLWAAEGFLKSNGSKDIEVVAEECLEDLIKRSLVLVSKKRYDGKIKTVKMHDLVRDLCIKKARDEKFLHVICEFLGCFPKDIENPRRLSAFSNICGDFPNMEPSCIHTLLLFRHWAFHHWKNFKLLRVVDSMSVCLPLNPVEIGELLHLKYLAVRFQPHDKDIWHDVPESWSKLQNLQTLIINNSFGIFSFLPFGLWRMPQLRHVIMSDGFLRNPHAQTSALEKLHTLTGLNGFTCSKRILELIPNLKKLGLVYAYEDIYGKEWSEFGLGNLIHLHKLEKFSFSATPHDHLSKNITFPVSLKKLTLEGSEIPWEDMSIIGSLPNLEVLKLKRHTCNGFVWETTEGQFCQLNVLLIESTDPCHWIAESSHFPKLQRLHLYKCHMLTEIPHSIGEISTLELIEVNCCNLTIVESAKLIEEEQHSFGNDLQVLLITASSDRAPTWKP